MHAPLNMSCPTGKLTKSFLKPSREGRGEPTGHREVSGSEATLNGTLMVDTYHYASVQTQNTHHQEQLKGKLWTP